MKKLLLTAILLFCGFGFAAEESKKVLLLIAHENFRDEEFFEPYNMLKEKGFVPVVASSSLSEAKGMLGAKVAPEVLLSDCRASDYAALVYVGGTGCTEYFENRHALALVRENAKQGRLTAAICLAPVILGKSGILKGRNATCFPTARKDLEDTGAVYIEEDVVEDGSIITANGPKSAKAFARTLISHLEKQE